MKRITKAGLIAAFAIFAVCMGSCNKVPETEEVAETPAPVVEAPVVEEVIQTPLVVVAPVIVVTPEPTPEPVPERDWMPEAEYLAKTVYGEALLCSKTEQAAVMWCILNRVDSNNAFFPDDIAGVVTQSQQFHGYAPNNPVTEELLELALDVIDRWQREKNGETDVGRVLPAEWLYFYGDLVAHNYFQKEFQGKELWNWSLPSPYEQ